MSKYRTTTWFKVDGNFETKIPMTSAELSRLLDEIYEKYGLYFGGSIKPVWNIESE